MSARIDADVLSEELAAYSDMDQESLDAVQDVTVGRMSFVRVRMFGPDPSMGGDGLLHRGRLPHRRGGAGRR